MKIKKSHLKELIRQSIAELKFKDKAAFDAYNKKHKMRKGTKVSVGGKDTTAGKVDKDGNYHHTGGDKLKSLKVRHPEKPSDDKKDLPFDPDPPKKR